ncbi:UNVERIFIED_ORG: hypothetical protein QE434_001998 [Rhizobium sp. SORGH_AS 755]|nr:hypothetical protein [Rhizobium sp. SORGH_AS_0755]
MEGKPIVTNDQLVRSINGCVRIVQFIAGRENVGRETTDALAIMSKDKVKKAQAIRVNTGIDFQQTPRSNLCLVPSISS